MRESLSKKCHKKKHELYKGRIATLRGWAGSDCPWAFSPSHHLLKETPSLAPQSVWSIGRRVPAQLWQAGSLTKRRLCYVCLTYGKISENNVTNESLDGEVSRNGKSRDGMDVFCKKEGKGH